MHLVRLPSRVIAHRRPLSPVSCSLALRLCADPTTLLPTRREHHREAGRTRHLDGHASRRPERTLLDYVPTPAHRRALVRLALHRACRDVVHPEFVRLAVHDQVPGQGLLFRKVAHVQGGPRPAHWRGLGYAGEQLRGAVEHDEQGYEDRRGVHGRDGSEGGGYRSAGGGTG